MTSETLERLEQDTADCVTDFALTAIPLTILALAYALFLACLWAW